MVSISISTKRSEKREPTGGREGEEAGMDVDNRKPPRRRIGLEMWVSGRMLGYPMNLKRRVLPRFWGIGGKWEGVRERVREVRGVREWWDGVFQSLHSLYRGHLC